MADQWYYKRGDNECGPVSPQELRRVAIAGELQPTDCVRKDGMADWVAASQVKGLFPTPSPVQDTPPPVPAAADVPLPLPQNLSVTDKLDDFAAKAKSFGGSIVAQGKAAAQLVAKQAERAKITGIDLPSAYQAFGRTIFSSGNCRAAFPSQHQQIDGLLNDIAAIHAAPAGQPKAEGMAGKAKAVAAATKDAAQVKALQIKANHALAELGKAVFEKHGTRVAPEEVTRSVADLLARLDALSEKIAHLSQSHTGQIVTPKRLAIGGVVLIALLVAACISYSAGFKGAGVNTDSASTAVNTDSASTAVNTDCASDFAGVDYSKGPNGERVEVKKFPKASKDGADVIEAGYTDSQGKFLAQGLVISQSADGKHKYFEGYFFADRQHGPYTRWYENGQIACKGAYMNGEQHGKLLTWLEDGTFESEGNYEHGEAHGLMRCNHPNGKPMSSLSWVHGKRHGPVIRWNDDGTKAIDGEYVNGNPVPTFKAEQHTQVEFLHKMKTLMPTVRDVAIAPLMVSGPAVYWVETFGHPPDRSSHASGGYQETWIYTCSDGRLLVRSSLNPIAMMAGKEVLVVEVGD